LISCFFDDCEWSATFLSSTSNERGEEGEGERGEKVSYYERKRSVDVMV